MRIVLTAPARPPSGVRHVHFTGIGGVGMAGLADVLRQRGFMISGSDMAENRFTRAFAEHGAVITKGHQDHVPEGTELLVYTSAVRADNRELLAARAQGIPCLRRGEALAAAFRAKGERRLIGVAGTHGKTTTTALLGHLLSSLHDEPGWVVGGESSQLGALACDGNPVAVECDESDGTLVHYQPTVGLVTNIEFDHMETFADAEAFLAIFKTFAANSERLVVCGDDSMARGLGEDGLTYGFGEDCELRGVDLELAADHSLFAVGGVDGIRFRLGVPGRHNVLNALGALGALALDTGADVKGVGQFIQTQAEALGPALASFQSVGRRFETVFDRDGLRVISDYAHHPTEIRVVLETARALKPKRLLAVFQPHRFSRTKALRAAFPPAFAGVDCLWLLPVYAASEDPVPGGTGKDLLAEFGDDVAVNWIPSLGDAEACIRPVLRPGDLLLILGAGDVVRLAGVDWLG